MMNEKFQPGLDGMPPIKEQYEDEEKFLIAQAARQYGFNVVKEAYGLKRQALAAWMRKKSFKKKMQIIIQSSEGQEITVNSIVAAVGEDVDRVYIRADENAAYWVRGEERGSVTLWN